MVRLPALNVAFNDTAATRYDCLANVILQSSRCPSTALITSFLHL